MLISYEKHIHIQQTFSLVSEVCHSNTKVSHALAEQKRTTFTEYSYFSSGMFQVMSMQFLKVGKTSVTFSAN